MLGRDVERIEVVEIVLDMRTLGDGEAHLAEDRHQLFHGLADRVDEADLTRARGQGDVDALLDEAPLEVHLLQLRLACFDRALQRDLD